MNATLLHQLARNWWVLLLRGVVGVLFGLLALVWPGITLVTMIMLYGAFAGAAGILEIIAAIRGGTMAPRWWLAIAGLVALVASAVTFFGAGRHRPGFDLHHRRLGRGPRHFRDYRRHPNS